MKYIYFLVAAALFLLAGCSQEKETMEKNEGKTNDTINNSLPELSYQAAAGKSKEGEKDMTYPQITKELAENEILAEMKTNKGMIKLKLFPEQAPKSVENFVTHSKNGYYDGVSFHRVIKDFMIQGGDPDGTGMGGESIYGEAFEDEFSRELFNFRGSLSMANAGPNTNGSQFFIVQNTQMDPGFREQMEKAGYPEEVVDYYMENGGTPWLDFRHTVFGQVTEGLDVVDSIANAPTAAQDKPAEDIIIEKITITE